MAKYLLKVKTVLITPKSYNEDKLAQYQGSKGHNATSDVSLRKSHLFPKHFEFVGIDVCS
jgi:hypothetical protein